MGESPGGCSLKQPTAPAQVQPGFRLVLFLMAGRLIFTGRPYMTASIRWAIVSLLVLTGGSLCLSQENNAKSDSHQVRAAIAGVWRGHSVCEVKNSPCHDEVNVYRFSSLPARPSAFSVTASKVVDGKEVVLGSGEWRYDGDKHIIESQAPPIRLAIDGDKMEGTLTLPDGTVYRRIYLKKES
jgi:hypothetical protein